MNKSSLEKAPVASTAAPERKSTKIGYRVKPFAEEVGLGVSTVWRMISQGKIKVVRVGGCTIIPDSERERLFTL
jgi:hypothetical protein